jgi:hypothetical protein
VEGEGRDREYGRGVALTVRAVLDLSYGFLTRDQVRALHLLASSPGTDEATEAGAALLGESATVSRRLLVSLARVHLLAQSPRTAGPCTAWSGSMPWSTA